MKKVLILLFVAGVVGFLVARSKGSDSREGAADDGTASAPLADQGGTADGSQVADGEGPVPTGPAPVPRAGSPALVAVDVADDYRAMVRYPGVSPQGPATPPMDERTAAALAKADELIRADRRVDARKLLTLCYLKARGNQAASLRKKLDAISKELTFDPRCMAGAESYTVVRGDTLTSIARKTKVNMRLIARLNGMKLSDVLTVGRQLKIIAGMPRLVVWKSEFRMALLIDDQYVKEYPVGIGREGCETPTGGFVVNSRVVRALWTGPDGKLIRYGEPGYQLGERWIGFKDEPGATGLGIHGTEDENTVGTRCSKGCLRMRNADVIELYDFVKVDTNVEVRE